MTQILFIILGLLASASAQGEETQSPNIIFINADDLGWSDLGCQGSEFYETPNIDKLASQGMRFTDAYAPAANCAPSRASVMTGLYSPRHGIYTVDSSRRGRAKDRKLVPTKNRTELEDSQKTIAEALRDAGYATGHFGKWHLGADPATQGFDLNIAGSEMGGPYLGGYHSPYNYPNCEQQEEGEYLTDRLGTEAIEFIKANQDRPFFLHFATYSVHTPIQGKAELVAKYEKKAPTQAHNSPAYAAMIESLDANVGRIIDTLEELGLSRNTLVLFTSDNGAVWALSKQWPLRAGKGSYYEGGIRVPLLVKWPQKIEPGTTCSVAVSGIDFLPTFLEAIGAGRSQAIGLDGASLMPLLTQSGAIEDRALFWHFPIYLQAYVKSGPVETTDPAFRTRPGSVVRHGEWKLHEYFENGDIELYNLSEDIGESSNLAAAHPGKVRQLRGMLSAWRSATGAPVPTELNPEYEP